MDVIAIYFAPSFYDKPIVAKFCNKWNTLLYDWELLVTHLYKYEEYVRNNGYVKFNDYLREIGVDILMRGEICTAQ